MAQLTTEENEELTREVARSSRGVPWTRPQVKAAFQAIEDEFENIRPQLAAAIDFALAPVTTTGAEKKRLVTAYLLQKAGRDR